MNDLLWIPDWPTQFSLLTITAVILIVGALSARVISPLLRIPEISAFLLCGFLIGPSGISLLPAGTIPGIETLADLALGLVLFELGRRIDVGWLIRERWTLLTSLAQGLCVFLGLLATLLAYDIPLNLALLTAALGCTTSPLIPLRISQELESEGQVTERVLHAVVLQCSLGFALFVGGLQSLHITQSADWFTILLHPSYLIFGSIALGYLASRIVRLLSWLFQGRAELQLVVVLGMVFLLVEANDLLKLSPLMSLLVFGVSSRGYSGNIALQTPTSSFGNYFVFAFLFVTLGTTLQISFRLETFGLALIISAVRWLLLMIPSTLLARANGLSLWHGVLWGSTLFPMTSLTIVLVNHTAELYPGIGYELTNLLGAMLLITYTIGPLITWWSIRLSGEARHNA
jgi:Kef-type K+ transport system membrane component KefB